MLQERDMIGEEPIDIEGMRCMQQGDVEENVVIATRFDQLRLGDADIVMRLRQGEGKFEIGWESLFNSAQDTNKSSGRDKVSM